MQGAVLPNHETVSGANHSRALISRGNGATGAGRGGTSRGEIGILALLRTLQDSRQTGGSRPPMPDSGSATTRGGALSGSPSPTRYGPLAPAAGTVDARSARATADPSVARHLHGCSGSRHDLLEEETHGHRHPHPP